ncbi:MAG: hypothetical protein V3S65_03340 [Candidatus Aminicenantaceae bacterium]
MKKNLLTLILMIGIGAIPIFAQYEYDSHRLEISPFAGYQFGGKLSVQAGTLSIKDAMNYGVALDFYIRPGMQVELAYIRQDTELRLANVLTGQKSPLFDMAVEHYQIGGLYEIRPGRVKPFALLTAGLTHFNPKPKDRSSEWRFSFGFGGGIKAFVSERIGFRFQGRLLFPYFPQGGGLWCSAPGGCFVALNGRLIVQADFTGGIFLAF